MSRPGFLARIALPAAVAFLAVAVPLSGQPKDEDCLVCHGDSGLKGAQGRSLFVDAAKFTASIHGSAGIACVDCHADLAKVSDFPHAEKLKPVDCASCHQAAATSIGASAHGAAPSGPAPSAAVLCKDCHGTHEIRPGDDPASRTFPLNIPETCTACHLGRVRTERGPAFVPPPEVARARPQLPNLNEPGIQPVAPPNAVSRSRGKSGSPPVGVPSGIGTSSPASGSCPIGAGPPFRRAVRNIDFASPKQIISRSESI